MLRRSMFVMRVYSSQEVDVFKIEDCDKRFHQDGKRGKSASEVELLIPMDQSATS